MAKIDTSKIGGFENMSAEEKLAALMNYEIDETAEIDRYKSAASKANSEAAAFKKNAKDGESRIAELEKKLADMEREKRILSLKTSYVKLGFDEDLAEKTAEAYVNGDDATVFSNHAAVNAAKEKAREADAVRGMPRPGAGNEKVLTKAEIYATDENGRFKLDSVERQEALKKLLATE